MRLVGVILARLMWFPVTMAGLIALTFVISHVIPADPVALIAGEFATQEQIETLRKEKGFERPLIVQLGSYFKDVLRGDLGVSLYTTQPIATDLALRLPATLELTVAGMAIAVGVGIPLGVFAARNKDTWIDHLLRTLSVSGLAVASFWLALILQIIFTMKLGWTPLQGRIAGSAPGGPTHLLVLDSLLALDYRALGSALFHLILPAVTLALPAMAVIVRFTRAGVLESINSDFAMYQTAMGFPARVTIWKYVLRSALTATITQIGLIFGGLLAGAVVVETVFSWPGIGSYAVESIMQSDYPAILGITLWSGIIFSLVNLLVDVMLAFVDPREAI